MKTVLNLLAVLSLLLTLVPSILVYRQEISLETHKMLMLMGTVGWFVIAIWRMKRSGNTADL